jgi:hypothetical protein
VKIVRGIYRKPNEELERIVYAHTTNRVLNQIKMKCGIESHQRHWKRDVNLRLDLLHFEANYKGIIKALKQGLTDGLDYAE